jgi:hypothetical protein
VFLPINYLEKNFLHIILKIIGRTLSILPAGVYATVWQPFMRKKNIFIKLYLQIVGQKISDKNIK